MPLAADISEYQAAGITPAPIIICRSSWGVGREDAHFSANRANASGYYHYSYPEYNSPEAEADSMAAIVGDNQGRSLWLDFEEPYPDPPGWSLRFLNRLRGRYPDAIIGIYLNENLLQSYDWRAVAGAGYKLWAAIWDNNLDPPFAGPFGQALIKQYRGSPLDLDVTYGPIEGIAHISLGSDDMAVILASSGVGTDPHGAGAVYLVANWPYGPKRWIANAGDLSPYTDGLQMQIQTVNAFLLDRCEEEAPIASGVYVKLDPDATAQLLATIKAELDAVQRAGVTGVTIDLSQVNTELANLGKHLGVDVKTGAGT